MESQDRFELQATAAYLNEAQEASILEEIQVVPNPYVAANVSEAKPFLSGEENGALNFEIYPTVRLKFTLQVVFLSVNYKLRMA